MNWQTPITALAGIAGVAIIALCYMLVLNTPPTVQRVEPSSPVLMATTLSQTADMESSSEAEPRPPASYDKTPLSAEISVSEEAMLQRSEQTIIDPVNVPTHDGSTQELLRHPTEPKAAHPNDRRPSDVITNTELAQMQSDLHLTKDQMPNWLRFVTALRSTGKLQSQANDVRRSNGDAKAEKSADLQPHALPLLQSLNNGQMRGAGRLSVILGFKNLPAMVDAVRASTAATVHKETEPRVAVTPTLPPVSKPPEVANKRYDGLLTRSEIGRIKLSLKLTPNQETLWPPVAAILGELGQQQMAQVDTGQKLDNAMSGAMAQRFYNAALPLLQTLTEDQKAEVRRRARTMGLEAYASYL